MSFRTLQRTLLLLGATLAFAGSAQAQTAPTAEGTLITNTASVSYTDGGTGSYTASGSVTVTVGFKAAITAASDETQVPADSSSGNTYTFSVANDGNGADTVSVAFVAGSGITITKYSFGGNDYATFLLFDAAIKAFELSRDGVAGDTVAITIEYSVDPGLGGLSRTIVATATSIRSTKPAYTAGAASDAVTLTITPAAVAVTPDADPISRAPGTYSATFSVFNNSPTAITYILSAGATGTGTSAGTITGTGVTTVGGVEQITIAAGGTVDIDVAYTVSNSSTIDPGDQGTLTLTASSTGAGAPSISDGGSYVVTVLRPRIVVSKVAYQSDGVTVIDSATMFVKPGDVIRYTITVSNTGNAGASDVEVTDAIPTELAFDFGMIGHPTTPSVIVDAPPAAPAWDLSASTAPNVVGKLSGLGTGESRSITIIVTVK